MLLDEFEGRERLFLLSTTHGAEMSSLGAFVATMMFMQKNNVVDLLWSYGEKLIKMMNDLANEYGIAESFKVAGIPCSPYYQTLDLNGANSLELRTLFAQEMIKSGVLMPWIALSYRHQEKEFELTKIALSKAFYIYRRAIEEGVEKYLEGPIIKPVFRKYN